MTSGVRGLVREWWAEPFDYRWLPDFFEARSLTTAVRFLVAALASLHVALSFLVLISPPAPTAALERGAIIFFGAGTITWVVRWCFGPWPTLRVSALFVVWSEVGITVVSAIDENPYSGLVCSMSLVLIGTYVTFVHGPRALAIHLLWFVASMIVVALPAATDPDSNLPLATAKLALLVVAFAAMPPILHIAFWLFRADAVDSQVDPLTGLLNRRGLHARAPQLISQDSSAEEAQLAMFAIDLDHFKIVNDTLGHAVGDEVLVRSARRIKSVVRGSAVLARLGGEEFVVIDVLPAAAVELLAERIRARIGEPATRAPITASLGIATVPAGNLAQANEDPVVQLDTLLDRADVAMYQAKREGRNRVAIAASESESAR